MLIPETHAAWHAFLTVLAGLPDPALESGPAAEVVRSVRAAQELFLQVAVDRRSGARPELSRIPPDEVPEVVLDVAAGLDPVPAALSWALLCEQQRDVAAALEEPEVGENPEAAALARLLSLRLIREAAEALRVLRTEEPRGLIFHLAPLEAWLSRTTPEYRPPSLQAEGFVHCTREPEVLEEVAALHFPDAPSPLALLVLDVALVRPEIRWEGTPRLFPHVYGAVNPEAVRDVRRFDRDAGGRWRFPWV